MQDTLEKVFTLVDINNMELLYKTNNLSYYDMKIIPEKFDAYLKDCKYTYILVFLNNDLTETNKNIKAITFIKGSFTYIVPTIVNLTHKKNIFGVIYNNTS